jgi:triosephosphate isomerase
MTRKKYIAGNWKMNTTLQEARSLSRALVLEINTMSNATINTLLFPPFPFLTAVLDEVSNSESIVVGAQNCHHQTNGAFTGEVSAVMLRSLGISYVLIGHSERRQYNGETNEQLAQKVQQAIHNQLIPVFCIGETLLERENNSHFTTIENQLQNGLFNLSASDFEQLIVAYEPVWAIGTGKTATADQAQEMHTFIRKTISQQYGKAIGEGCSILYGGSCNPTNAAELFACPDVDGGLIGGASLKIADFLAIRTAMIQQLSD